MADALVSRDELLRQAEKHQRQGRADLAIEVFERLADLAPTDWNVVKQLADLLERAGHREAAAARFLQCADHYGQEGFHPRAAALYRKVLKLEPHSEHALCQLADISLQLKLAVDARQALAQVLALRRRRGDTAAADAIAARLAALDASPGAAGRTAASAPPVASPGLPSGSVLPTSPAPETDAAVADGSETARQEETEPASRAEVGETAVPAAPALLGARLRTLAREAEARGDLAGARRAWRAVLHIEPGDRPLRLRLLAQALEEADVDLAVTLAAALSPDDAEARAWQFRVACLARRGDEERLATAATREGHALAVYEQLVPVDRIAAAEWASLVVGALSREAGAHAVATFVEAAHAHHPAPIDCLLRWVEVCVDADLPALDTAQLALAAAYLRQGQPHLARAVADDLLLRRPDLEDVRALALRVHEACGDADADASLDALLAPVSGADAFAEAFPIPEADGGPAASVEQAGWTDDALSATAAGIPTEPAATAAAEPFASFDWGALLGRDVPPSPPPTPTASAPAAGVDTGQGPRGAGEEPRARPTAGEAPDAPGPEPDAPARAVEEVDLTALLDDLVPARPSALFEPADEDSATATGVTSSRRAPERSPFADDESADNDRSLAAQQVAAGRVFAAAGLVAEAARAFERASKEVRTRFDAAQSLAALHRSRGQLTEAIRWFDVAAQSPAPDAAVRRPVLYDLAETLETIGETDRALAVWLDLLSEVEDYRDARARADHLLRVDAGG